MNQKWTWEKQNGFYESEYHQGHLEIGGFHVLSVIGDVSEAMEDPKLIENIVRALNRELPDGKPRSHKKKAVS